MPWENRIRQAAYTPSGGQRFVFDFEDVSRVTEKRTSAFSFPGINDNYIQDNGFGSRQYELRCIFSGPECDTTATNFEAALLSFGVGQLEHPLYGTFNAVPFGTITRRDDLKTGANQAIVEVTFWTTTGVVYPTAERSPRNEVYASIDTFNEVQPTAYAQSMELNTLQKIQNLRGVVDASLRDVNRRLSVVAETNVEIMREFRGWQQTINRGINTLIGNPVLLCQQFANMIQAPARAAIGIQNRVTAYANFLRDIYTSDVGQPYVQVGTASSPKRQANMANDFRTADMNALNALVSMALSAVEAQYATRPEALSVAEFLLSELAALAAWREAGFAAFALPEYGARIQVLDDGEAWQAAQETVLLCAGYLVNLSFGLAVERIEIIDRPRTIIDLAAEWYGEIDERLDFIIDTNGLTGSEILEIPRNARLVWYPS